MELLKEVILRPELSPQAEPRRPQCFLWMDMESVQHFSAHPLSLHPVTTPEQEETLRKVRIEAEVPSGNASHEVWYLATVGNQPVGVVGIVEFETQQGRIGRLQDICISPRFQGLGYGNLLLSAACRVSQRIGLDALVIVTDAVGWARHWCIRRGFKELEVANSATRSN